MWQLPVDISALLRYDHPISSILVATVVLDDPLVAVRNTREVATEEYGARIEGSLTSETFVSRRTRIFQYLAAAVESHFEPDYRLSASAESLLAADTTANTCWPLAGAYGTVGVRLPRTTHLVAATVRFARSELLRRSVGYPAKLRFWGLVPDHDYGRLPAHCTALDRTFPAAVVNNTLGGRPLLLSEWSADDSAFSDATIPFTLCTVPTDLILLEVWGSVPTVLYTCINRLHLLGS